MTPLWAYPLGDGFVFALAHGPNVDWCCNIMASGKGTLTWKEQEYALEKPELLERSEELKALPVFTRVLYTAGGIKQFVWVHQQKEVPEKAQGGLTS